jgi:hypothetical protein
VPAGRAFTGQAFHRLAGQVAAEQLAQAQIEIARLGLGLRAGPRPAPGHATATLTDRINQDARIESDQPPRLSWIIDRMARRHRQPVPRRVLLEIAQ